MKNKDKIEILKETILAFGYKQSPRNPNSFISSDGNRRYKFSSTTLRKDGKTSDGKWIFLSSGYIRDIEVTSEGKLKGISVNGCQAKKKSYVL